MGGFHRENPLFSLCGLNCGACWAQLPPLDVPLTERAAKAAALLKRVADERHIECKLRKKPKQ